VSRPSRDVERFGRWAHTYERSRLQRMVFDPIQRTLLDVAVAEKAGAEAILDVGCGTGRLLRAAADAFPDARLCGVDAAAEMVEVAQAQLVAGERTELRQAVAEALPFPNESFDLVFSTMTFHHWSDQGRGMAEVARVMRSDATWLLSDFVATGFMRYVRRALRLQRFRERKELDLMLGQAGLRVTASRLVAGLGGQVPVLVIGKEPG
jgi:ubiquinone/menaquinone biosynthesis C-methylase UbiE